MNIPIPMEFPAPQILQDVILKSSYSKRGEFSVTEILEDPRCVCLKREHPEEVEHDASKNIKAFVGTAVHELIEKRLREHIPEGRLETGDEYHIEAQLETEVEGRHLTGTADMIKVLNREKKIGVITDWKNVSASKYMMQDFGNFYHQLQIYKMMAHEYFTGCDEIMIQNVMIFSDWTHHNLMRFGNKYPQNQIVTLKWRAMPDDMIFQDVKNRIQQIAMYEKLPEDQRPDASPENVWNTLNTVRLMKSGGKRAVSGGVFKRDPGMTEEELYEQMEESKPELEQKHGRLDTVEERKGRIKCNHYCPVAKHCTPFQESIRADNELQIII